MLLSKKYLYILRFKKLLTDPFRSLSPFLSILSRFLFSFFFFLFRLAVVKSSFVASSGNLVVPYKNFVNEAKSMINQFNQKVLII